MGLDRQGDLAAAAVVDLRHDTKSVLPAAGQPGAPDVLVLQLAEGSVHHRDRSRRTMDDDLLQVLEVVVPVDKEAHSLGGVRPAPGEANLREP